MPLNVLFSIRTEPRVVTRRPLVGIDSNVEFLTVTFGVHVAFSTTYSFAVIEEGTGLSSVRTI
ncbi:hypothetical protein D3C71_1809080 [compost metagenome]